MEKLHFWSYRLLMYSLIHPPTHPPFHPSIHPAIHSSAVHPSVYLSLQPSICPSFYPPNKPEEVHLRPCPGHWGSEEGKGGAQTPPSCHFRSAHSATKSPSNPMIRICRLSRTIPYNFCFRFWDDVTQMALARSSGFQSWLDHHY